MKRFWVKVQKSDGCWGWIGTIRSKERPYGQVWFRGRLHVAHRVAWILTNGKIPEGVSVLHSCDNPNCVRPDHLFLGTQFDNMQDCSAKGRLAMQRHPERSSLHQIKTRAKGTTNGAAKLTVDIVAQIRAWKSEGLPTIEIARRCGVHQTTIDRVLRGVHWGHVGEPYAAARSRGKGEG